MSANFCAIDFHTPPALFTQTRNPSDRALQSASKTRRNQSVAPQRRDRQPLDQDESSDLSSEATQYTNSQQSSLNSLLSTNTLPDTDPADVLRIRREVELVLAGDKAEGRVDGISEATWEEFCVWSADIKRNWQNLKCVFTLYRPFIH